MAGDAEVVAVAVQDSGPGPGQRGIDVAAVDGPRWRQSQEPPQTRPVNADGPQGGVEVGAGAGVAFEDQAASRGRPADAAHEVELRVIRERPAGPAAEDRDDDQQRRLLLATGRERDPAAPPVQDQVQDEPAAGGVDAAHAGPVDVRGVEVNAVASGGFAVPHHPVQDRQRRSRTGVNRWGCRVGDTGTAGCQHQRRGQQRDAGDSGRTDPPRWNQHVRTVTPPKRPLGRFAQVALSRAQRAGPGQGGGIGFPP